MNDEIESNHKIGSNAIYGRKNKSNFEPKGKESRTTDDLIEFTSDAANQSLATSIQSIDKQSKIIIKSR